VSGFFKTTIWSSIRLARKGRSSALNDFVKKYREPVVQFLRRQGRSAEDAEDLAQEVFMVVFRDNLLSRAEQSRGRFRSFLLGVLKNVMRNAERVDHAQKRGGGKSPVSLDAAIQDEDVLGDSLTAGEKDEDFDREWTHHIIRLSLLQVACIHPHYYEALKLHIDDHLSSTEIAERLQLTPKQADNLLQQARRKLGEQIRSEIAAYCSSRPEFEDEVAYLSKFLNPE